MNVVYRYLSDFFSLFYPQLCGACGTNLVSNESVICSSCCYHLPETNFHLYADNRVAKQFWGRVPFLSCSAYLYFSKGSRVQRLMHQLKYNNKPEVGVKLGQMYGNQLKKNFTGALPDLLIPVPLHPAKQKKRGYNQSESFAQGLSASLGIPVDNKILQRSHFTETQTKKSRFNRYENMRDVFTVKDASVLEGKHVLLVDDIITTGATVESCANALLKVNSLTISIAAIAFTD